MRLKTTALTFSLPLALTLAAACGGGSDSGGAPQGQGGQVGSAGVSDLPCDVATFVSTNCLGCHSDPPTNTAPVSLVTTADFRKKGISSPATPDGADKTLGELAVEKLSATKNAMPPPPRTAATDAEKATLAAWVAAGMPARAVGETCGGQGGSGQGGAAQAGGGGVAQGGAASAGSGQAGAGGAPTADCKPDIILKGQTPWTMPKATADEYVCFGVEVPATGDDRHVTALIPKVDNTKIVHHLLVYRVDPGEKISGTPAPCKNVVKPGWKLYYAWGPGTPAAVLPKEAGYRLPGAESTHYIVNVHYSNLTHLDGEKDATEIQLCSDKPRQYDADVLAVGSTSFSLPAHSKSTIECTTKAAIIPSTAPYKVFQTWPHMHLLGSHLATDILHSDGTKTPVTDLPYDFYNQITYPLDLTVDKSDTFVTRCTWDNTTSASVGFGENTSQEMCFNFLSYYPAPPPGATWAWIAPATLATCKKQ